MIHHIEENQINEEIIKNSHKLVMIDFFADWCMPCQMLTPVLSEVDKKYPNVEIYKVNVDESPSVSMLYDINSVPTILFFKNGREVERKIGLESVQKLSEIIEAYEEI